MNGTLFEEVNHEKDAVMEIEALNVELDAQIAAREMSLETMESVGRLIYGAVIDGMTSQELKRDVLLYARSYPIQFLEMINDPGLTETAMASKALSSGLFAMRNNNREIWFNLPGNKRKLMNLQPGDDAVSALTVYFESEEGLPVAEVVKNKLS